MVSSVYDQSTRHTDRDLLMNEIDKISREVSGEMRCLCYYRYRLLVFLRSILIRTSDRRHWPRSKRLYFQCVEHKRSRCQCLLIRFRLNSGAVQFFLYIFGSHIPECLAFFYLLPVRDTFRTSKNFCPIKFTE